MKETRNRQASSLDPAVLAAMKEEMAFISNQQRSARRIKLEKGQNALVRFLPARFGPNALWYARIARHWLNKVPIVCPRLTGKDFGGELGADCPVCALAEELNDDRDKDTSDFGWRLKANPTYLTYCVLFEKDGVTKPLEEILVPYEFTLAKATWLELHAFFVAGGRTSPDSVLDYRSGTDFTANRTHQGIRLFPGSQGPIFELDHNFDTNISKLEKALKSPKVQIPTRDQLEAFVAKVWDEAVKFRHGRHETDDPGRSQERASMPQGDEDDPSGRGPDRDRVSLEGGGSGAQGENAGNRVRNDVQGGSKARVLPPESKSPAQGLHNPEAHPTTKPPGPLPLTEKRARMKTEVESAAPQHADDDDDNLPEEDKDTVPPAEPLPASDEPEPEPDTGEKPTKVFRKGATAETIEARVAKLKGRT